MPWMADAFLELGAVLSRNELFRCYFMPLLRALGLRQTDPAEVTVHAQALQRRADNRCRGSGSRNASAEDSGLRKAAEAAADADACVVVLGTNGWWESEGMDQPHMGLPGNQDALVERVVAAARGPVIVVLNVGSPKELPWLDTVSAVVLAHFAGQEMGPAVADVLFGATCPAGRLPTTWPRRLDDSPYLGSVPATAAASSTLSAVPGETHYNEGLRMGYRGFTKNAPPLFPFGFGLSYTTFTYAGLEVKLSKLCNVGSGGPEAVVKVRVTNTGACTGEEVVQLYSQAEEGIRTLGAFARTQAIDPGMVAEVTLKLGPRALGSRFDVAAGAWSRPRPGSNVKLEVGTSSHDTRVSSTLVLA